MASSTTTQSTPTLTANAGSLPRKPQVNAGPQRPKLTGWAQAAARALPKSSTPQQHSQHSQTTGALTSPTQQRGSPSSSSPSLKKSKKQLNNNNNNNNNNSNNNRPRQPYNREEVRTYMKSLFAQYTSPSTSISTYSGLNNSRKGNNLDWGAVTNNRYRNKKYGCLNEIAQVLRN